MTTSDILLWKIYLSLYLKGLCVRGSGRPNRTATYWPSHSYGHQRFFPVLLGCSTGSLGAQLLWVLVFSTASYLQLVWTPNSQSGVPRDPSAGWYFLYSIISPTHWSPNWLNFLCTELYNSLTATQYLPITGHRNMPFRRLWNGMFDRHRAEITVMQFTGHSLPMHQFVSVPWDFTPVPYCQPNSPTPIEYTLPPSLEWHVWPGLRSIYNIYAWLQ